MVFWYRATHHLSQDVNTLFDVQPYSGTDQVTIGNGKKISILHTGSKILPSTFKNFHLQKVLHVSHITANLISVSKLCTNNNTFFEFYPQYFLVKDWATNKVLLQGHLKNDLHKFSSTFVSPLVETLDYFILMPWMV